MVKDWKIIEPYGTKADDPRIFRHSLQHSGTGGAPADNYLFLDGHVEALHNPIDDNHTDSATGKTVNRLRWAGYVSLGAYTP